MKACLESSIGNCLKAQSLVPWGKLFTEDAFTGTPRLPSGLLYSGMSSIFPPMLCISVSVDVSVQPAHFVVSVQDTTKWPQGHLGHAMQVESAPPSNSQVRSSAHMKKIIMKKQKKMFSTVVYIFSFRFIYS
jgi:hypothetical protein